MAEADQALTNPEEDLGGVMSLREHLNELRKRLTIAVLAVILCSFVVWPFKDFVVHFGQLPLPRGAVLQQIAVTETLFTFVKISFIVGFGLASPIVVYQVLAFVAPGLYPRERRWIFMSIPAVALAFLTGVAFAWCGSRWGFWRDLRPPRSPRNSRSMAGFRLFCASCWPWDWRSRHHS